MDPNTTLMNLRTALQDFRVAEDQDDSAGQLRHASELADAVEALDTWLTKGGFPPKGWTK